MKKISAVFVFSLFIGGSLWAQSDEPLAVETEASALPALSASTDPAGGNFRQEGVASWYGAEFAGRATASGEIFDPSQFTAAHADLPFGTYLVVTNTENGKKIAVRVNDRGPFVRSRILDVSRASAERLDMLTAGTAKVVIESTTREAAQSLMREMGVAAATPSSPPPAAARANPAGTPSMAPAAPRTPVQSVIAPVPAASVSRVTGQVENIPEIRRPADPGYVVVDEQVPPAVLRTAPASATTAAPAAASAPAASRATTPASAATAAPTASSPLAAAPRNAAPAVTPVETEPQSAPQSEPQSAPVQTNPAASVPVTGPQPGAEKIEFTGSPIVQGKNYRVQVGSFADLKNASDIFLKLFDAGLNPSYERYEDKYRVVITNVKAEDADDLSRKLAGIGLTEAPLVREDAER